MKDELTGLNWVGKSRSIIKGSQDVRISLVNRANDRLAATFTLYSGCHELITENSYIQVAIFKNRVFFKGADEKTGIKCSIATGSTSKTRYAKLNDPDTCAALIAFEGCYELKYDSFYELYYIEKEA